MARPRALGLTGTPWRVAMKVFAISGLKGRLKEELLTAGAHLSCAFSPVLDLTCTHLISNTVTSDKYMFAVHNKVPVVRAEWLLDSAQRGELQPEISYLIPPLHDAHIVVTGHGFDQEMRGRLGQVVVALGGTLAGGLSPECTHLVVESAAPTEKLLACCCSAELAPRELC